MKLQRALATGVFSTLVFLSAACGGAAPTPPVPFQTDRPAMILDKVRVDLGEVAADARTAQTFLAGNLGGQTLVAEIDSVTTLSGCDSVEIAAAAPALIGVRKLGELPLVFGPHKQLGEHRHEISVRSNDPLRPRTPVEVRFEVVDAPVRPAGGPYLRVDKEFVDIGEVPFDRPLFERFTVWNAGDEPLTLLDAPRLRVEEGC